MSSTYAPDACKHCHIYIYILAIWLLHISDERGTNSFLCRRAWKLRKNKWLP